MEGGRGVAVGWVVQGGVSVVRVVVSVTVDTGEVRWTAVIPGVLGRERSEHS